MTIISEYLVANNPCGKKIVRDLRNKIIFAFNEFF
jgi:hypothetical protein